MLMAIDLERLQSSLSGGLGRSLEQHATVSSTMDLARDRALAGAPEGLVVLAEEQTAGRGRMGRSWVSPPGLNLYFTLLLRPDLESLRRLPYTMPLGICRGLETMGFGPAIKWPNDLQAGGRKLCGVLIDTVVDGDAVAAALVGIGLNVNLRASHHPEIREIATSLCEIAGRDLERERVLAAVLNGIAAALDAAPATAFGAWRARLVTLGRAVSLRAGEEIVQGLAVDVDERGSLVIEFADGTLRTFAAGEVTSQL